MSEIVINVAYNQVALPSDIAVGDVASVSLRVVNVPDEWTDKTVYALIKKRDKSELFELSADGGGYTRDIPPQYMRDEGSFSIVVMATGGDSTYRDVVPTVWVECREGIPTDANILPADDEVGRLVELIILAEDSYIKLGDVAEIKAKLDTVEEGAEVNVQSDWQETNPEADSFIHGKPDIDAIKSELEGEIDDAKSDAYKAIDEAKVMAGNVGTALDKHRNNEDENAQHLTQAEKDDVRKIGGIESDVNSLTLSDIPTLWRSVNDNANRIYALTAPPETTVPTTLEVNTSYNFGHLYELSLSFPQDVNDGDVIHIAFVSGDIPTNLIIDTTNTSNIDLVPEAYTIYEMYAKFNSEVGSWLANYSEWDLN